MVNTVSIALDSCRKIFVERDYSRGLAVKFQRAFPPALEGIMRREDWEETIDNINKEFGIAEKVCFASFIETIVGLFTCYLSRLFIPTLYERQLAKIREYIRLRNREVFLPIGVYFFDPMEKGLRVIEVNILSTGLLVSQPPPHSRSRQMTIAVEEV